MRSALLPVLLLAAAACGDDLRAGDGGGGTPDGGPPPPDGGTTSPDIRREQAGGNPTAVRLAGDLVYVAIGPRLVIWRDGALVGESEPLPGMPTAIALAGDRAFVSQHTDLAGRVHVIDVSDPARPVETASFRVVAEGFTVPLGMAIAGDRLYVADQEQGIAEVDIADPDVPEVLRVVPRGGVTELIVAGDRLYYLATSFLGGGVGALDLADDLADLGETSLFNANGITVTPNDLVVAAGVGGIQVVDVSDLSSPVERFAYSYEEGGPFARAVAASRTRAWIPADEGMHVLNLSDPDNIRRRGPFDLATAGTNAAARDGDVLAVVSDRGELGLFDVGAVAPTRTAAVPITVCSDCIGVFTDGERLAIGDAAGGLRTAAVADLSLVGRLRPDGFVDYEDVALAGDLAYAADWFWGLRIHDVSDPAEPALIGGVDTAGFPSSVFIAGDRAYLGESTNGGNLRVIDISVPAEAAEIGATTTSQTRDVEVRDGLAFIAEGSLDLVGGLRIFDVSDPEDIRLVAHYSEDCTEALDVALTGDLVVVACSFDGFHVLDVADPARPVRRAVVPAPEIAAAWSVAAWDGGAALGHDRGVIVVDLADPAAPADPGTGPEPRRHQRHPDPTTRPHA
ncbi:MAG TPA: hypothetical protein VFU21_03605 [Kofleriaceae bacterium]|nr:hypothetical protein [Kofleriaceae bacterium]